MSGHMKMHLTKKKESVIYMQYNGNFYQFPTYIAEKYKVADKSQKNSVDEKAVFSKLNEKYTRPGALLRGIRIRENLTQKQMAEKIQVTQSDISQMENGTRPIGKKIAKRIAEIFDVDYRSLLSL